MNQASLILILEAMAIYFLVLWTHSLRHRFGLAHFYALIGGLTAIMSWITDAGVKVEVMGITFMVGSTVFSRRFRKLKPFAVFCLSAPTVKKSAMMKDIGNKSKSISKIDRMLNSATVSAPNARKSCILN